MRKALVCLILSLQALDADEITFREKFADPSTRSAAIGLLVPGSREAFFHTALDHQLAGRTEEFDRTIAEWKTASERDANPISNEGLDVLENRQLLMGYAKDPSATLTQLIRKFELTYNDTKPDAESEALNIPTRIDPAAISRDSFEKVASALAGPRAYTNHDQRRLMEELAKYEEFDYPKLLWFLDKIERSDHAAIVPMVARTLKFENQPVQFGTHPIHGKLVFSQLAALLELHPDLRSNDAFNVSYLEKMQPGQEVDFDRDRNAQAAYLKDCRDYVVTLPRAADPLKAFVLYHHLRLQSQLGNHPKEDFIAYLSLPRKEDEFFGPREERLSPIQFGGLVPKGTGCEAITNERPLIEAYLDHFLSQSDDAAAPFVPFIRASVLDRMQARARLLAGADPKRWSASILPIYFKALQEETSIAFASGAPSVLSGDAEASLVLDLKNTPDLSIRIYELDLPAYLARAGEEPSVSIDLEGLVPHHERRIAYKDAPIRKHRETIDLPELAGSGAWIVEFLSGQVSARALIRKGQLIPYLERTAAGQVVRLFDEAGNPVKAGSVQLGAERFTADAEGRIIVPNSRHQTVTEGIVRAGKLAAMLELGNRNDNFKMEAAFHLEREQLLADQEAKLHLRVRLTDRSQEIPLDRIKDPALVMKAELLGGITTERVIAEDLKLAPVMEIPFQVPADLQVITFTLRGTIQPDGGGDPVSLSEGSTYQLNGDLNGTTVARAYFSPVSTGHRLELRGRNGEPLVSRVLQFTFTHRDYLKQVKLSARTDEKGRIDLGKLEDIETVEVEGTHISPSLYRPATRDLHQNDVQTIAGKDIVFPLYEPAGKPDRSTLSLFETRNGTTVRDHFDKLHIENGRVVIRGLAPGNYSFGNGRDLTSIIVSGGKISGNLIASAAGIVPIHLPPNPFIGKATAADGQLLVNLRDFSPETRLTITGNRYAHNGWNTGFAADLFENDPARILKPGVVPCGYLTEKLLDDEMRYIFDRRSQKVFPGSMLPRPGLLLNRWTIKDLDQETQDGEDGSGGNFSNGGGAPMFFGQAMRGNKKHQPGNDPAAYDFLARPAVVFFDLKPQPDGSLKLPLEAFKDSQFIEIRVSDIGSGDSAIVPLPANETPLRDRRIARPLDPKAHHLATRSAAVLAKGATASIENLLDAEWRAFTTLEEAQQFLYGMTSDDRLRDFAFLPDWPSFDEKKKIALLSTHACHEFHLFLSRKDNAFFEKHVKPLLSQKAEPQFMDDLLLGRDLKSNLRPYAWNKLNAAEKALLARALPDARERITRDLSLRWQTEEPSPTAETMLFTQTLRGSDLTSIDSLGLAKNELSGETDAQRAIAAKLNSLIIPRIDFQDTSLEEAIDFLRLRSVELDSLESDPAKRGFNFIAHSGGGDAPRIRNLQVRQVPFMTALQYIAQATNTRLKIDDYSVSFVPLFESAEDLVTHTFEVPADFADSLESAGGANGGAAPDPFAPDADSMAGSKLTTRRSIKDLLIANGIMIPEGASVVLSGNRLIVRNTRGELEKIEGLTDAMKSMASEESNESRVLPELPSTAAPAAPADPFGPETEADASKMQVKRAYRFPERTRLWNESYYFRNTSPTDESLIPLNRFWIDLAAWDGNGPFLSAHFNACRHNANEALMCLAVLDLPFKADRPEVTVDGNTLRVKAREPMLLFFKDTKRTDKVAPESALLVRQTFTPVEEPLRTADGTEIENPVIGDFRPGVPYRASLVVTNPTGIGRRIDLLAQIPAGAIPLGGNPMTLSATENLKPYGVIMREMSFYFPATGEFTSYPLHVSENGVVLAHSEQRTLKISNDPAPQDASSWLVVAKEGTNEQVLARLRTENLKTIDLSAIRWRLKDKAFFSSTASIFRERLHYSETIGSFGLYHQDVHVIRDFFENSGMPQKLGSWLDSPLLEIRPRVHHDWTTLEFDPLVNARAHRFGNEERITHSAARKHYQAFLDQLAWKPALDAPDHLTLAAFLFLQDRVEEALARFDLIDPAKLPGRIHYDYLQAVAHFYREKPAEAKAIATRHLPSLPPGIWQDRFQAVSDQADEIASLAQAPVKEKQGGEVSAPQLDLAATGDGKLLVKHRSLDKASLRLFNVDLEILFSKDPFLKGGDAGSSDPSILPNADLEIKLVAAAGETTVELPASIKKGNVLVSADSNGTRLLKVLDSREIDIRHLQAERTVQILDSTGKPLSKSYVKVYTETRSGEIAFHKDGYTDLRGKFDYLSHTAVDTSTIKRVAILVNHPEKGARTVIYDR